MVCIAAFIVLCLISVFVAFLSIFRRDIGKKYLKVFKKSWGCVGKRVTLQKCESGFKDDVKNSLLKKVVIKHPKIVKPLSVTIEIASILIVFVSIWSLAEAAKAGMALWTLGSCNVRRPSACSLSAEACSIDSGNEPKNFIEGVGYWFSDWVEIFGAVPDKFRSWDTDQFELAGINMGYQAGLDKPKAIDIFDPGCEVCASSFKAQLEDDFFTKYQVTLVAFPIKKDENSYKFANSELIVRYMLATSQQGNPAKETEENSLPAAYKILSRIFLEQNHEKKSYQFLFNNEYSSEEAEAKLISWLKEFGYSSAERSEIIERTKSDEITNILEHNDDIVMNNIHAKGIPTMIYDGKKHTGKYEAK